MNVICVDGHTRQIQTNDASVTVGEYADRIGVALGQAGPFTLKLDGHLAHPDCPLIVLAAAETIEQVGVSETDWYAVDEYGELVEPPAPDVSLTGGAVLPVLDLDADPALPATEPEPVDPPNTEPPEPPVPDALGQDAAHTPDEDLQ